MAAIPQSHLPLRQAKASRRRLPYYLRLDGGRYLIAAAVVLSLMSLLLLGQTGRLATKGYEIGQLQAHRTELLREINAARLRLSELGALTRIEQRAKEAGLRPATDEQTRYITVAPRQAESQRTAPPATPAPPGP
jgi:cell division protein FtsL